MEKSAVFCCDRRNPVQNGLIVFGTKDDGVHRIGGKAVTRHLVGKERVARQDKAFAKAFKKPIGIMIYNICPDTCADDHMFPRIQNEKIISHFKAFVKHAVPARQYGCTTVSIFDSYAAFFIIKRTISVCKLVDNMFFQAHNHKLCHKLL